MLIVLLWDNLYIYSPFSPSFFPLILKFISLSSACVPRLGEGGHNNRLVVTIKCPLTLPGEVRGESEGNPRGTEGTGRGDAAPWERSDLFSDNISINCWHLTVLVLIFFHGVVEARFYAECATCGNMGWCIYIYGMNTHIACTSKIRMCVRVNVTHNFRYNWIYICKDYFSVGVYYPFEKHICQRRVLKPADMLLSRSGTLGKEWIRERKKSITIKWEKKDRKYGKILSVFLHPCPFFL